MWVGVNVKKESQTHHLSKFATFNSAQHIFRPVKCDFKMCTSFWHNSRGNYSRVKTFYLTFVKIMPEIKLFLSLFNPNPPDGGCIKDSHFFISILL